MSENYISRVINPPTIDEQIAAICDKLDKLNSQMAEMIQMQTIVASMPRHQRYVAQAKAGVPQ